MEFRRSLWQQICAFDNNFLTIISWEIETFLNYENNQTISMKIWKIYKELRNLEERFAILIFHK